MEMEEAPIVLESALKHGLEEEDALDAWRTRAPGGLTQDGVTMWIGSSRTGELLELLIGSWWGGLVVVYHAMLARRRYLPSHMRRTR